MQLDSTGLLAAAALFATIMPSLSDVRRASVGGTVSQDVRNGILVGSSILVGCGAMLSAEQHSRKPLLMLGGVALLIGLAYELTLRQTGSAQVTAEPGPSHHGGLGRYGV